MQSPPHWMVFGMLLVPGGSTTPPVPPLAPLAPLAPVPPVLVAGVPAPAAAPPLAWPAAPVLLSELPHATGRARHNVVARTMVFPKEHDCIVGPQQVG